MLGSIQDIYDFKFYLISYTYREDKICSQGMDILDHYVNYFDMQATGRFLWRQRAFHGNVADAHTDPVHRIVNMQDLRRCLLDYQRSRACNLTDSHGHHLF